MKIFEFDSYQNFLKTFLSNGKKKEHGSLIKIAQYMNISPSIVTLVLQGKKEFTIEQASDLADYLGLNDLESDYLILLVGYSRAGKAGLKKKLKRQLEQLKTQALDLKNRIPPSVELADSVNYIFYSDWCFSAIRILSSIEKYQTIDKMSEYLNLPLSKVKKVIEFLLQHNLCVEKNGLITIGPQSTHVNSESPHAIRHHKNWRERSLLYLDRPKSEDLFFTSPVSIAANDFSKVREILLESIEASFQIINPSECEKMACLNIDWFNLK